MTSASWKCLFSTSNIACAKPHKKNRDVTSTKGTRYSLFTNDFFIFSILLLFCFILILQRCLSPYSHPTIYRAFFPHQPVDSRYDQPGDTKCDNRCGRYLQSDRDMQGTHPGQPRTGKEIMYHINPEPASRQVRQQALEPFRTVRPPFANRKTGIVIITTLREQ